MRLRTKRILGLLLCACAATGGTGLAQTRALTEIECRSLRERLAEHARLSDGVRRALAVQAARYPAPPQPVIPSATAPTVPAPSRAETIRTRLAQIPTDRRRLEDERNGALLRFEMTRAAQIQGQLQALDAERNNLERELSGLPAGSGGAVPAPPSPRGTPPPAPPAALQPLSDADRIPCQDLPAAHESAVKTRQRELGAKEGQAGAMPLLAFRGRTPDQIAQELAGQFAAWPLAAAQVGLFDQDGDGRLDGFVDVPAPNAFRLYRLRSDGSVGVELFSVSTPGMATGYDEMARRLEEASLRQARRGLLDLLASRPAAPIRVLAEAGEFAKAQGFVLAGNIAEAARVEGGGARTAEFQNYRGETLRVLEFIAPITAGLAVRRLVATSLPNNE